MKLLFLVVPLLATGRVQAQTRPDLGRHEPQALPAAAPAETVSTVLAGCVLTSAGSPAEGAVVVSSAGGRTVTGADGSFRLEVELAPAAAVRTLELTAVHGSGTSRAAGRLGVTLPVPGGASWTGVLTLAQGGTCTPAWQPTFGAPGPDDVVYSQVVFDDGTGPALYVGGSFRRIGAVAANHIAKWDGTSWSALADGVSAAGSSSVFALAVFDDGNGPALHAGGTFTSAGGVAASGLAKWDGTSWSALGSGVTNGSGPDVRALAVFDDGSGAGPALYAGGTFTMAGGLATSRIARWNGTSWSGLGGGLTGSGGSIVWALAVFDDGGGAALCAGGSFTSAGGIAANRIAKWNGTSWASLGSGMNDGVVALTVFDDGGGTALYAGGIFTTAGGAPASGVARWNGTSWSPLGSGVNAGVYALAAHDDGGGPALYAGGSFSAAGGGVANRIARWDGAHWSSVGGGMDGFVNALTSFDDGSGSVLCAGGAFRAAGGVPAPYLAKWSGGWSTFDSGSNRSLNQSVRALEVFDAGTGPALFAGGAFTIAGGSSANHIAKWDGASWASLGSGVGGVASATVVSLAAFDDGGGPALYAGGQFTTAGGVPAKHIARWNGASWSPLGSGMGGTFSFFGPMVNSLEVFDDGGGAGPALYAGGDFTLAGGVQAYGIAKWDGAVWSPVRNGLVGAVYALAVFDDGSGPVLVAGGDFVQTGGGTTVNHVAKWNGTRWSSFGTGLDGRVYALAVFDDGSGSGPALYAGGTFAETMSGATVNDVAKWDGASWTALGSGVAESFFPSVFALTAFDDGSGDGPALYAGGHFSTAGGEAARNIATWNGSGWSSPGSGVDGQVLAFSVHDDGSGKSLYAGGDFRLAFDSLDAFLARWQGCTDSTPPTLSCPAEVFMLDPWSGPPGESVTFSVTADDESDPSPSIVCVPPSGSFFPRGTTPVTCTATDASGNQSTCEFEVTVAPKAHRH